MQAATIFFKHSRFHYLYGGQGPQPIVALHGYGQKADVFQCLTGAMEKEYFLVAVDLPFHGSTEWKEKSEFTPADLFGVINKIMEIHGFVSKSFILLGFSLGGRLALSMLEHHPASIAKLVLLAPDGIRSGFWYRFVTQNALGKKLFHRTMEDPRWMFKMFWLGKKWGFLNERLYNFLVSHTDNEHSRLLLYQRWTCLRLFAPVISKIRSVISTQNIPVRILYGKKDQIIRASQATPLSAGLENHCRVIVIDEGHHLLQPKHAQAILRLVRS